MLRKLRTTLLLLGITTLSFGYDYSYIYIQGDLETPFYVKLEGQMMPRLGKNYCIIPNLDTGIIHVQILFQQNAYPEQEFTIRVPEAGARGFALQKINDRQFALYDLQSGKFLVAGNEEDNDSMISGGNLIAESESELPPFRGTETRGTTKEIPRRNRFIEDVELNSGKSQSDELPAFGSGAAYTPGSAKPQRRANDKNRRTTVLHDGSGKVIEEEYPNDDYTVFTPPATESRIEVPNSDCPEAMSNSEFEDLAIRVLDKNDDLARLKYINKSGVKYCYTTEQVRILASNIESPSARYEMVIALYPRVVDQAEFPKLEQLFKAGYLKKKFMAAIK